jgi:transcription antitermination factor NusG
MCITSELRGATKPAFGALYAGDFRRWYAVFTSSQHEKSVLRQLELREIESFLPTYEAERVWKNRQRVKLTVPLFPSYVFVRIERGERARVLQSPGVLSIVGNHRELLAIPDEQIDVLRSGLWAKGIEPYDGLVVGTSVRIKSGPFQGIQGTLVRRNGHHRFVLTVHLINRHASFEVDADNVEPVIEEPQ